MAPVAPIARTFARRTHEVLVGTRRNKSKDGAIDDVVLFDSVPAD